MQTINEKIFQFFLFFLKILSTAEFDVIQLENVAFRKYKNLNKTRSKQILNSVGIFMFETTLFSEIIMFNRNNRKILMY